MLGNRSYRIRTNVREDSVVNVQLNQDIDILEILSLKIGAENAYKLHTSQYGCVVGRVLANEAFGIPNAKVSIFIEASSTDLEDNILSYLYPYKSVYTKNDDNIRYNLLSEEQLTDCHQNVGSFPSKRLVLDDDNVLEIYDKYYKFTTRTNSSGDYMIFGVPVGNQQLHVDIDLSDIGVLSQRPRDMVYKGYNITQFENANMFKKDTNLDSLAQIITQNSNLEVYPFWGEESEGIISISRKDIDVNYKFEPTCVFIGSLVSEDRSNGFSHKCIPTERMGRMDKLIASEGTIEMIRKTPNGDVESFTIQGNQLIDGNGTWCYQIPMNLDYVKTDEYGNIVPTDNIEKGIPTRTRARFRVSINDTQSNYGENHLAKVLIPNNPQNYSELDYSFGSNTYDDEFGTLSFRDLFWNKVYTVKSYIPRIQKGNAQRNKRFSGIKTVNVNNENNPIPYNNMRVDITFMFILQCAIIKIMITLTAVINYIQNAIDSSSSNEHACTVLGDGLCPDLEGWYFAPGCSQVGHLKLTLNTIRDGEVGGMPTKDQKSTDYTNETKGEAYRTQSTPKSNDADAICITTKVDYLLQCIEINLAMEYEVIQFDFYNDWINGLLYIPRWFAYIKQKRSFLFGLIRIPSKVMGCLENTFSNTRRYVQQCSLKYTLDNEKEIYNKIISHKGCISDNKQKCHRSGGRNHLVIFGNGSKGGGGAVHTEQTLRGEYVYYFKPCEWINNNNDYGTKVNFFATDIVLLGSLNENDNEGIPQTFTKIPSSSFQMPTNLAATNMDEASYMYYLTEGTYRDGSMCIQGKIRSGQEGGIPTEISKEPIEPYKDTFSNFHEWSRTKDYYEEDIDDETEYAVTEMSGIDWGYSGPNQKGNNGDNLYYPGGHFLSIACLNAAVNIKSCVNLSRVCELGSMRSQRQSIPYSKLTDEGYTLDYYHLIPTGFISRDEINDNGAKAEFATLNFNNLKTKRNENNQLEYDFISVTPLNFDGSLETYVNNSSYNVLEGFSDNEELEGNKDAFKRTIEKANIDYYNFRMGNKNGDLSYLRNKYGVVDGEEVMLPMYENSFYFYFGIQDGATALDRFYNDFYAECPSLKNYEAKIIIYELEESEECGENGKVVFGFKNIDPTIFWNLVKHGTTQVLLPKRVMTVTGKIGKNITYTDSAMTSTLILTSSSETFTLDKGCSVKLLGNDIRAIELGVVLPEGCTLGSFNVYTELVDIYNGEEVTTRLWSNSKMATSLSGTSTITYNLPSDFSFSLYSGKHTLVYNVKIGYSDLVLQSLELESLSIMEPQYDSMRFELQEERYETVVQDSSIASGKTNNIFEKITVNRLEGDTNYTIEVDGSNVFGLKADFKIGKKEDEVLKELEIQSENFSSYVHYTNEQLTTEGSVPQLGNAYIKLNGLNDDITGIAIYNNGYYLYTKYKSRSDNWLELFDPKITANRLEVTNSQFKFNDGCAPWEGNSTYYIVVAYKCSGYEEEKYKILQDSVRITMPTA